MLSFKPEGGDVFYCLGRDVPFLTAYYVKLLCENVPEFQKYNPADVLQARVFDRELLEALGFLVLDTILKNQ